MNPDKSDRLVIAEVTLVVDELSKVSDFYQQALGLSPIALQPDMHVLGVGERGFMRLRADSDARRWRPREAGLFHTAFLLPSRADLAAWLQHAIALRLPLSGASDHLVSEALYLQDPEGNGIEVYADRPRAQWQWRGGEVVMATERLDIDGLLAAAARPWQGAPPEARIGHVHLQVGDIAEAEAFYRQQLGLDLTCRYPGALFLSVGGYHHHVAVNTWNSGGAARRRPPVTGLAELTLKMARGTDAGAIATASSLEDPWGIPFKVIGDTGPAH